MDGCHFGHVTKLNVGWTELDEQAPKKCECLSVNSQYGAGPVFSISFFSYEKIGKIEHKQIRKIS
jgi:hypothetical protein